MFPAVLFSLLSAHLLTGAVAQSAEAVSIDFYTDVLYSPPEAWNSVINSACGGIDHWTTTINASAKITFVGTPRHLAFAPYPAAHPRARRAVA